MKGKKGYSVPGFLGRYKAPCLAFEVGPDFKSSLGAGHYEIWASGDIDPNNGGSHGKQNGM